MHAINLDDKNSKRTDQVSLFTDINVYYHYLAVYFDSFGIEYIPQEILNKVRVESTTHNIFRIQGNAHIMCGCYCIAFTEYMFAEKTLLDCTNLFSPNDYKENEKTTYMYFKDKCGRRRRSRS